MLLGMDTASRPGEKTKAPRLEIAAEKQRRLAREATMIAEARASAAAGRVVSSEKVDAWIDSLDTDHELRASFRAARR
jgi:predicted transcriptional regulator